ncbi:MAG: TonB family protein, partial [Bacteroidota bacterium]
ENFSSNGNLVKEGFYANGVIAGPWKTFNKDNGQVTFSYFFQGGKLNGPFQVFDDEGTLQTEGAFKNNEVETNSNPEVNIPWPTEIITMAQFPGCNDDLPKEAAIECGHEKLLAYLAEHIEYPESARKNGVEGMVVIGFLVDKSGKVVDPKIMRSLDQSTNSEALKLVQNMPDWIPGHVDGRPVKTSFNLPIRFSLSDGQIPILPGNN